MLQFLIQALFFPAINLGKSVCVCVYVEGLGLNITKTWGFIEIGGGGGVEGGRGVE